MRLLPRIDSIKQVRKRLGITQKKLAEMAQVSTSMINQIESGRSKPGYETAKRIFDSMAALEGRSSAHKAGDFCSKSIIKLGPSSTLHHAITQLQRHSISQIPVFDKKTPVGVITEDGIVSYLARPGKEGLERTRLEHAMEPAPPIVDYDTPAGALVTLIRFTKCILVSRNSKIVGIITASDTLRMIET